MEGTSGRQRVSWQALAEFNLRLPEKGKRKKIGKIFDPRKFTLPRGCSCFAQSPQVLVFDDFVRVYFSSRELESSGMYVSHVAWVDFDKEFQCVLKVSPEVVIERGQLGCFDEHGIFPISPLRYRDRIIAYTTGWSRRVSVSVETAIGMVESYDGGATFERLGHGPVLSASLNEPFLVGDGFLWPFRFDDDCECGKRQTNPRHPKQFCTCIKF